MTYVSEPVAAAQIQAECPACDKDRCFCTPRQRLDAVLIAAEFDAYVAELNERNAKRRPRDTQPLAGWSKGWDR